MVASSANGRRSRTRAGRVIAIVAGVVLVALGALAVRTARDVRRGELAFPPIGDFAEIDGVRLHYLARGRGQAVVLLHGNPGFIEDYTTGPDNLVDELAEEYRVIVIDRPGHGYSARPSAAQTTPHEQARLVHDLLGRLGIERPVLVGHSWGGGLALIYAEEYPGEIAALVLLGTRAYPSADRADPVYALNRMPLIGSLFRATLLPPVGQRLLEERLKSAYAPDSIRAGHLAAARALWMRPSQVAATVWDTKNLQAALDGANRSYAKISVPVVIVVGDHDRGISESRRLALAIPSAVLHVLPNAGHEIQITRPSALLAALREASSAARRR